MIEGQVPCRVLKEVLSRHRELQLLRRIDPVEVASPVA
jgi:hypothetical protein